MTDPDFLKMSADEIFIFCCSHNWSKDAEQLWKNYRTATSDRRGALLLGAKEGRPEDAKHLLSGAVFDEFCRKESFNEERRVEFERQLWGRYDHY